VRCRLRQPASLMQASAPARRVTFFAPPTKVTKETTPDRSAPPQGGAVLLAFCGAVRAAPV